MPNPATRRDRRAAPTRRALLQGSAAALALAGCAQPVLTGSRSVTLLHVNDTHGRHLPFQVGPGNATAQTGDPGREHEEFERSGQVGGFARLATAIAQARVQHGADRVLLLHGGDTFSDDLLGNLTRGEAVIRLMNAVGFDFMALGNHDFDYGRERTAELQGIADFAMRGANVLDGESPFLGTPWRVFTRGGVWVGVLALGYHNTADTGSRKNVEGLRFTSGIEAARRWLPEVRRAADVVVVLSHQGSAVDRLLAREVSGIDVIVGAHSHDRLAPPERVAGTWLVQALSDGAALGVLTLQLAPDGRVADVTGRVRTLWTDMLAEDPHIARLVAQLRAPHRAALEAPVAEAIDRIGRNYRSESPFDVLVGDILRAHTGADIAMLPGVGYGVSLEPGVFTREALHTLLPHPTPLATLTLTGRQVIEVLEQSATNQRPASPLDRVGGLVQTSGLRWTVDLRRPVGGRVSDVTLAGASLAADRRVRVATHEGMLGGLHRYRSLSEGTEVRVHEERVADVVEAALHQRGRVRAPALGHITLRR